MSRLLITTIASLLCFSVFSQRLHTPSETHRMMEESKVSYVLDTLHEKIRLPLFPVLEYKESKFTNVETNKKRIKYQKKGAKYLKKENYRKALQFYKQSFTDSTDIETIKKLSDCHLALNELKQTIEHNEMLLGLRPGDFALREKTAKLYAKIGNGESAIKEITLAHLYNRNDRGLIKSLQRIFQANGLIYHNWTFNPQYKIEQNKKGEVNILFKETPWLAYASCKAIWKYEETYAENMKKLSNSDIAIVEEKECLLNALITYEKLISGKAKFPAIKALSIALPKKKIKTYILYEIEMRKNPSLIFDLSKKDINDLMEYILLIRCKN